MDDLDRRIISALQHNARDSTTNLAAHLGVARTTVHERITRLEEKGIIAGYTVVLRGTDATKITVKVLLEVQQKYSARIVEKLQSYPEVHQCLSTNGEYDLMVTAQAPRLEDLDTLVNEIGSLPGVTRTSTLVVFGSRIDRRQQI